MSDDTPTGFARAPDRYTAGGTERETIDEMRDLAYQQAVRLVGDKHDGIVDGVTPDELADELFAYHCDGYCPNLNDVQIREAGRPALGARRATRDQGARGRGLRRVRGGDGTIRVRGRAPFNSENVTWTKTLLSDSLPVSPLLSSLRFSDGQKCVAS